MALYCPFLTVISNDKDTKLNDEDQVQILDEDKSDNLPSYSDLQAPLNSYKPFLQEISGEEASFDQTQSKYSLTVTAWLN